MTIIRRRPLRQYKYLMFLSMLFITIFVICDTTIFRMVDVHGREVPLSGFIIPLLFAIGDIIAEAYGYRITMKVLKCGIVCQCLFGIIVTIALLAPSTPNNLVNTSYHMAFEHILRANFGSCFSVTSGMLVNAFFISKLKIYMNGKNFWFRSILSSGISEIVLCSVAYMLILTGLKSFSEVIWIIYWVWIYKMLFSILISPFTAMIGKLIKRVEASDVYDLGINYNPLHDMSDCLVEFEDEKITRTVKKTNGRAHDSNFQIFKFKKNSNDPIMLS